MKLLEKREHSTHKTFHLIHHKSYVFTCIYNGKWVFEGHHIVQIIHNFCLSFIKRFLFLFFRVITVNFTTQNCLLAFDFWRPVTIGSAIQYQNWSFQFVTLQSKLQKVTQTCFSRGANFDKSISVQSTFLRSIQKSRCPVDWGHLNSKRLGNALILRYTNTSALVYSITLSWVLFDIQWGWK